MQFKLTNAEIAERDKLKEWLVDAREELKSVISLANKAIHDAASSVATAADEYNGLLANASEFRDEIVSRMRDAFDEKSDKWQESDKGQEIDTLITSIEDIDLSDIDIIEPDDIEEPDMDHSDELERLGEAE